MAELELAIDRLSQGAEGVGRGPDGRVVFVQGALPGERVLAKVHMEKKRFAKASLSRILVASEDRVEPACVHAKTCGGCQLWHIAQDSELALKAQAAIEAMTRVGRLGESLPEAVLRPSPEAERYRCRATFHLRGSVARGRKAGFHQEQSHKIIELEQCLVIAHPLERAYEELSWAMPSLERAELLCEVAHPEQVVVTIWLEDARGLEALKAEATRWCERSNCVRGVVLSVGRERREEVGQTQIPVNMALSSVPDSLAGGAVPAGLFRQANPAVNHALAQRLLELVSSAGCQRMVELFCGCGNFSFALSKQLDALEAFEGFGESVEAAKRLAQSYPHPNLTFEVADLMGQGAKRWFDQYQWGQIDGVLLDPPRAGARELCQLLAEPPQGLEHIFYISCDPACLGRDLGELGERWRVESLEIYDMFPRTAHVETLVWLKRA